MTPDQILRAAAEHLYDLAAKADTGGPWKAVPDLLIGGTAVVTHDAGEDGPHLANFVRPEHAAYIALMHPGVALILAAVFERAAKALAEADVAKTEPILILARAILAQRPQ